MPPRDIDPGTERELHGKCGFCSGQEQGYAKKDENGNWKLACWKCVKPKNLQPPTKRSLTGVS